MLTLAIVMGLGEPDTGDLLGLRDFAGRMIGRYPCDAAFFAHDDPNLHEKFAAIENPFGIGHSNGGQELSDIDIEFAAAGRNMAGICMLDAKPKWDGLSGLAHWFDENYAYPVPRSTSIYHAFYGGFGCPFEGRIESTKLTIAGPFHGHAGFPSDARVQDWLEQKIYFLTSNPPEQAIA